MSACCAALPPTPMAMSPRNAKRWSWDVTSIAMAAHNSDGVVIVQVERIAMNGSLAPKNVLIPGALVDCVVRSKPENHHQTFGTPYEHAFSGEMRVPLEELPVMPLDERKIMARRAVMELPIGGVVNLGIGIPEGVAKVAAEEGLLDQVTLSAEAGTIGGMPQGGARLRRLTESRCHYCHQYPIRLL